MSFSTQTLLEVGTVTQLATLSYTSLCKSLHFPHLLKCGKFLRESWRKYKYLPSYGTIVLLLRHSPLFRHDLLMDTPKNEPRAPHVCHKSHGAQSQWSHIGIMIGLSHRSHIGITHTIGLSHWSHIGIVHTIGIIRKERARPDKGSRIIRCNLEVAIIRLISQIPMLIWLRTMAEL